LLLDRLRVALEGEIRQLDPAIPTILLAHLMADTATFGAERLLAVGKGFTVPLTFLTRDCFDYVALGHVHKHQILSEQPYVIYPGSIERVDFSEEKEEKGYVLVELEKGQTTVEYCPIPVRAFRTLNVDLTKAKDPQKQLLIAIAAADIADAVVRVKYDLRADQLDRIDEPEIHNALAIAHTYNLQRSLVTQESRSRLPELKDSNIHPIEALQTYLNNRHDLGDLATPMLEAAQLLLQDEAGQIRLELPVRLIEWAENPDQTVIADCALSREWVEIQPEDSQQLRLL
jgi:DNA repair protein SbcD/Mre11